MSTTLMSRGGGRGAARRARRSTSGTCIGCTCASSRHIRPSSVGSMVTYIMMAVSVSVHDEGGRYSSSPFREATSAVSRHRSVSDRLQSTRLDSIDALEELCELDRNPHDRRDLSLKADWLLVGVLGRPADLRRARKIRPKPPTAHRQSRIMTEARVAP